MRKNLKMQKIEHFEALSYQTVTNVIHCLTVDILCLNNTKTLQINVTLCQEISKITV